MKDNISNISILVIILTSLFFFYYYIYTITIEKTKEKEISIKTDKELEEYIIKVVACEMPALYEVEALKAQAIASRTYALYQRDVNNVSLTKQDQCFNTEEEMKDKWQADYSLYYKKIKDAVMDTASLVMKIDNQLFKSFYFSTSNGYTEDSITVFKEGNIKSVSSLWDKENKNYEVKTNFTKDKLVNILGDFNKIEISKRSSTNHVEEVLVDKKSYSGIEFRKLLGLRSTDFIISIVDNVYEITTYGYGHGVGMSQFGANMLAKEEKTASEILKYYYGDIEILKY